MATVYKLDPLRDRRWRAFIEGHPNGSVFHSTAWLEALRQTYGFQPVVFTTSPPTGEVSNGLLFCRVRSWLTSLRMVSLPFSDHCEPLCTLEETQFLTRYLQCELDHQKWKYLEIRPLNGGFRYSSDTTGFQAVAKYCIHRMDLRDDLQELFRRLDKSSIQRRVHRAERSALTVREMRQGPRNCCRISFRLSILTRRRQLVCPSATFRVWFKNLIQSFGDALEIRTAYMGQNACSRHSLLCASETPRIINTGARMPNSTTSAPCHSFCGTRSRSAKVQLSATVFDMGRTDPAVDVGLDGVQK